MEKRYIKPRIEVTVIVTESAIAAGSSVGLGSGDKDGSGSMSKEQAFWDED